MVLSVPVVAALFHISNANSQEDASLLQMPVVEKNVQTDTADSDCVCPGYFEDQCRENAHQGCIWTDVGESNAPWCQCDPDWVPPPRPPAPPTTPPAPPPAPPAPSTCGGAGVHHSTCRSGDSAAQGCVYVLSADVEACGVTSWGCYPQMDLPQGCPQAQESTHYYVVNSWPEHAWGAWDAEARSSPIEKCLAKDLTADPDGTGFLFTSCCTSDGAGMSRDCGTTGNTNFETAAAQCASQGGRLCTAEEAMSQATVSQGCSVDGPSSATGADLNRLWTSTPCALAPTCPAGWVQVGQPGADIGGCGLESCGARYNTPTEEDCATKCDTFEECDGFNFAPRDGDRNHEDETVCTLYSSNEPTGTWSGSAGFVQVFCVRETAGSTAECPADVLDKCQGNTPCIDLREAAIHHHLMWLNDDGTAHVDGEANGINAGDSRTWTCTRDGDGVGLVGTWNCPGFYSTVIRITADFADDFTDARDNDFIHVCALPEAEHTGYGLPCTEGTATIDGVPVCTVAPDDGNSNPWVLFGDIDHQISNFVESQVTSSPTSSGLRNGDSVQVGTFSTGAIGSSGYSLDIGQFCTGGSCNANFDLMIQYGDSNVFSHSENGYSTTSGGFINNGHTAQGVVIGEHGLWGSNTDRPGGYYATFCAYNGGCRSNGNDFWAFSEHGVYPNSPDSVVCGMYYGGPGTPWKNCPSGDNGHRMRYYIRSADLEVTFPSTD